MGKVKIATENLYAPPGGWAIAHLAGDEVPAETEADLKRIEDAGWADKVANPQTKAAKAAETVKEA